MATVAGGGRSGSAKLSMIHDRDAPESVAADPLDRPVDTRSSCAVQDRNAESTLSAGLNLTPRHDGGNTPRACVIDRNTKHVLRGR